MDELVIGLAALITSVLSAVAGLGGGIVLLAVIAQFFAPAVAIPIHGAIQFVSNGSRAALLRRDIAWRAVLWGSVLLFPASLLGVALATSLPERATRLILGAFLVVVAWWPGLLRWRGGRALPDTALLGVGAASGFLNSTVGASGPFTSPFYKAVTATHVAFVATAATSQVIAHASKVAAYAFGGFALGDHLTVIVVGCAGVIAGSWIGTRLLGRISDVSLDRVFRIVLTVLALRLIAL